VESAQAREQAESKKVQEEERLKSEAARISTEEELAIAEENKQRQVLVAQRSKERTDGVELERVERDRQLEEIERERLTALKRIESDKMIEVERKNIQDVIKDRVMVEKTVVIEQEKIKDTEAFAAADREKQVAVTLAEKTAQEAMVREVKAAEASKDAAKLKADEEAFTVTRAAEAAREAAKMKAEERVIGAEAEQDAAEKEANAMKLLAEATVKESSAKGIGEADVVRAKGTAEAEAIRDKADAMKLFEEAGQTHEEFKLRLEKDKEIEIAEIRVRAEIAAKQSEVVGAALKSARIDIVGGETEFFDRIVNAVGHGRSIDRAVENSQTLTDIKETFFNGDPDYFKAQLRDWLDRSGIASEDVKNLTVSALMAKLASDPSHNSGFLKTLAGAAERFGLQKKKVSELLGGR
jgi:uncharacterized membrane protein YqiK